MLNSEVARMQYLQNQVVLTVDEAAELYCLEKIYNDEALTEKTERTDKNEE